MLTKVLGCFPVVVLLLGGALGLCQKNQKIAISPLSLTSLHLKILHNETEIGQATGFVVEKNEKPYLITNRHVVLLCAQDKDPSDVGGWVCANRIDIYQNRLGHLGEWFWVEEDLYDAHHKERWLEDPLLGSRADLIALPIEHTQDVQFFPLDMSLAKKDIGLSPGDSVSIVGFPYGMAQAAGLPIWKSGTIASDPDINFDGKQMFLVDSTSRPGMSGSPVYAVRRGVIRSAHGSVAVTQSPVTKFLGVYSEQSLSEEICAVWKSEVVIDLYNSLP